MDLCALRKQILVFVEMNIARFNHTVVIVYNALAIEAIKTNVLTLKSSLVLFLARASGARWYLDRWIIDRIKKGSIESIVLTHVTGVHILPNIRCNVVSSSTIETLRFFVFVRTKQVESHQ